MLIHDILPPEKIKKIAKEDILGIRSYKNKKSKYLNIYLRLLIIAIIFIEIFSTFSPLEVFGESGFLGSEKKEEKVQEAPLFPVAEEPKIEKEIQEPDNFGANLSELSVDNLEELKIKKVKSNKQDNLDVFAFKSKAGDLIEIGEERHSPAQPYLKLNKWDGEVSLKVDIPYAKNGAKTLAENKLKWKNHKHDVDFYPKEPKEISEEIAGEKHTFKINEEGGVEFDVILKENPETNIFEFPIETQGLKFYYQPLLHPDHPTWADEDGDEIADSFRPENVVGSYAAYHESKQGDYSKMGGKNYKTGKAFHIYRPKITDAEENEIWGEINISDGKLTITIDQNWLNDAVYPVIVDPTFGYETGGSIAVGTVNYINGGNFQILEDGTAESITVYLSDITTGEKVKCAIYDSDGNYIATTEERNDITSNDWHTFNFSSSPSLTANSYYYLFVWSGSYGSFYYDSGTKVLTWKWSNSYNGWPVTYDKSRDYNNYNASIYCTYTATAASTYQPRPAGVGASGGGFMMY